MVEREILKGMRCDLYLTFLAAVQGRLTICCIIRWKRLVQCALNAGQKQSSYCQRLLYWQHLRQTLPSFLWSGERSFAHASDICLPAIRLSLRMVINNTRTSTPIAIGLSLFAVSIPRMSIPPPFQATSVKDTTSAHL